MLKLAESTRKGSQRIGIVSSSPFMLIFTKAQFLEFAF